MKRSSAKRLKARLVNLPSLLREYITSYGSTVGTGSGVNARKRFIKLDRIMGALIKNRI